MDSKSSGETFPKVADETAALLADPRFGATPAERQDRLDTAKGVAIALFLGGLVVGIGLLFVSDLRMKLTVALGSLLAGIAMVRQSGGLGWLVVHRTRHSAMGLLFPAAMLAIEAMDFQLIGGVTLAWISAGAAIAIAVGLAARNKAMWFLSPFIAFYGGFAIYGLAATTDVALGPPVARHFPLLVNDMYESGKKNTKFYLKLAAWDDQPSGPIAAPLGYYFKVHVGSLVCVFRHTGALGIDWIEVGNCPPGSKPTPAVLAEFATQPHPALPPPQAPTQNEQPPDGYPEAAWRAGKEGVATLDCNVATTDLKLTNCRVISESPPGLGFGEAAIKRVTSPDSGLNPNQLRGHAEVAFPVKFKLTD